MSRRPSNKISAWGAALERRTADLTILYGVSRALQGPFEEEKTLNIILTGITHRRGLGFNRAFILTVDTETQCLEGRLAAGPSSLEESRSIWQEQHERLLNLGKVLECPPAAGRDLHVREIVSRFHIPLSQSENLLIRIMRARKACRVKDGTLHPHGWAVEPWLPEVLGTEVFAVAPLCMAGSDLGLLIADNAVTRAPITIDSLRLLQIYAQVTAASIQNLRLYHELTERIGVCENSNRMLRESQDHLLQAERLSTIGKMAALLAHEIRTPLVSIGGFARRLLRGTPDTDHRKEELEIIVSEVARLEKLVEEVLGYTRISRSNYESTDINDLLESVFATMQHLIEKNQVRTELELDPGLPPAGVDRSQLQQALVNLIDNALDAMPGGGQLTISTSWQEGFYEIGIADTGVGIASEHWNKLFIPFFTTKPSGTGLGLAVVSQVVENHKGSLRFESTAGQGTSFRIRLPFDPERGLAEPNRISVVDRRGGYSDENHPRGR